MTSLEQFRKDSIEKFEFSRGPHNLLIDRIVGRSKVLIDLREDIRMITDLSKLHQCVLQGGSFPRFATRCQLLSLPTD